MNAIMKNNSKEVGTQVETFVIEETSDLIWDNEKLDQWNDYVRILGLGGQTKIFTKDKSPIPFLPLKNSMAAVFQCLCPRAVCIAEFDVQPIPVEILSLVSLAIAEKHFNKIEIWYDENTPDPVCIGSTGYWYQPSWYDTRDKSLDNMRFDTEKELIDMGVKHIQFKETQKYIIGKWADVKHSFEELKKMATKRFVLENANRIKKSIKDSQRELDDLESVAFERFN